MKARDLVKSLYIMLLPRRDNTLSLFVHGFVNVTAIKKATRQLAEECLQIDMIIHYPTGALIYIYLLHCSHSIIVHDIVFRCSRAKDIWVVTDCMLYTRLKFILER